MNGPEGGWRIGILGVTPERLDLSMVTRRERCDAEVVSTSMVPSADLVTSRESAALRAAADRGWWGGVWQRLMRPPSAELILAQLNGQLAVLEGARAELETGWVQGGSWWGAPACG